MCDIHKNINDKVKLMDYIYLEDFAFDLTKSKSDLDTVIYEWQILQEEKLELQVLQYLSDIQESTMEKFDELIKDVYVNKSFFDLQIFLKDIKLYPNLSFEQVGIFELDKHTFPVKVKRYFEKADPVTRVIDQIAGVDGDELRNILNSSSIDSMNAGGQSVFNIFDIKDNQFVVLDEKAIAKLEAFNLKLSNQVASGINSRIKFQLLEGIKNAEGIPELRKRINSLWNRPITVKVDPLVRGGKIVRSGYSYQIGAKQWATVVGRTEVVRSFTEGRLEAYKQSGVVDKVEFVVAPDERVCPICMGLEGEEYTLEQSAGVIPVHAACRCTFIPVFENKKWRNDARARSKINETVSNNVSAKYSGLINKVKNNHPGMINDASNKLSVETYKVLGDVLDDLNKNYKGAYNLVKNEQGYRTYSEYKKIIKKNNYTNLVISEDGTIFGFSLENALRYQYPELNGIFLNDAKSMLGGGNISSLRNRIKRGISSNWSFQGDSPTAIIYHETLHMIKNVLLDVKINGKIGLRLYDDIVRKYKKTIGKKSIRAELGEYAVTNEDEFLAQLWAKYKVNPDGMSDKFKKMAKEIDDLFKKIK